MTIHLYCFCRDEEKLLPYFFRHYDPIVDAYFFFDNESRDGSPALIASHPKTTLTAVTYDYPFKSTAASLLINEAWKKSKGLADWIIVADIDEHIWHPDLAGYLRERQQEGHTVIPTIGYQMISDHFPTTDGLLCDEIKEGVPDPHFSKPAIFNPNAIEQMYYSMGRHTALPEGEVHYPIMREVKLLHYKYLGFDYTYHRHRELSSYLSPMDRVNFLQRYDWSRDRLLLEFMQYLERARNIFTTTHFASRRHQLTETQQIDQQDTFKQAYESMTIMKARLNMVEVEMDETKRRSQIAIDRMRQQQHAIQSSVSYRLGRALTAPFRFIYDLFRPKEQ